MRFTPTLSGTETSFISKRVPGITHYRMPAQEQQAIATAADIVIAPSMTSLKASGNMETQSFTQTRGNILDAIRELKGDLAQIGNPESSLEERLNQLKTQIEEERKRKYPDFAYRFGARSARIHLLEAGTQPSISDQTVIDYCAYYSAYEYLHVAKPDIYAAPNPFDPILGMVANGVREFHFVNTDGKEKVETHLTPVSQGQQPTMIAA